VVPFTLDSRAECCQNRRMNWWLLLYPAFYLFAAMVRDAAIASLSVVQRPLLWNQNRSGMFLQLPVFPLLMHLTILLNSRSRKNLGAARSIRAIFFFFARWGFATALILAPWTWWMVPAGFILFATWDPARL
jgi:hypothetical protein